MNQDDNAAARARNGLGALSARGMGRGSLIAAAAAPFLAARSPGAALLFLLLPVYTVFQRGNFSAPGDGSFADGASKTADQNAPPAEILARLAGAFLAVLVAGTACAVGAYLAQRIRPQTLREPWGLAAAGSAASLAFTAVYLPILAAAGRKAARNAGGALFALIGLLAAASALPAGSGYALLLLALYSGKTPGLSLGLLAGAAVLAAASGAVSWGVSRRRRG